MKTNFCIAAMLFLLASCGQVAGQLDDSGWTQFRGPNGTGHYNASAPLPSTLDKDSLNWQLEIPEVGAMRHRR
jgi:hypothetical protein